MGEEKKIRKYLVTFSRFAAPGVFTGHPPQVDFRCRSFKIHPSGNGIIMEDAVVEKDGAGPAGQIYFTLDNYDYVLTSPLVSEEFTVEFENEPDQEAVAKYVPAGLPCDFCKTHPAAHESWSAG